jgi:hypothetical protein
LFSLLHALIHDDTKDNTRQGEGKKGGDAEDDGDNTQKAAGEEGRGVMKREK